MVVQAHLAGPSMMFDYVWVHTDNCERCFRCDFCDEGKRLMREASKAAADALAYGLLDRRPQVKA
jgi:hypothetical protein